MFFSLTMRHMRRYARERADSGFTLIELSVVLIIIGLIIGTLAPLMMGIIKKDKIKSGRTTVERARDEIIGYAMSHKKLPSSIKEVGHNRDPWQNDLFLIIAPKIKDKDICSIDHTELALELLEANSLGSCTKKEIIKDVACIVGSKGPDYNRQLSKVKSYKVTAADYMCEFDFYPDDAIRKGPFDDIFEFITLSELKARICH